ncbi:MAG TPA: hypothetical protein VHV75_08005 [Solirubrobacteraceae bacterium]|nr:hypothetical protein [Solirubrobacteraceae bacterium]
MGKPDNLLEFARDDQNGDALYSQACDQLVDRTFGADVDSAGRLVSDQHSRRPHQPFGERDLLLIPSRKSGHLHFGARSADVHTAEHSGYELAFMRLAKDPGARDLLEVRHGDVLKDWPVHG